MASSESTTDTKGFDDHFEGKNVVQNGDKEPEIKYPQTGEFKCTYEETFQGPHKWRQQLRHIARTDNETEVQDFEMDCDQYNFSDEINQKQPIFPESTLKHVTREVKAPPWKQELLDKTKSIRQMSKQAVPVYGGQASQIPVTVRRRGSFQGHGESAFTRQVVNQGLAVSAARKRLSPANSFRQTNLNSSANTGRRMLPQGGALLDVSTNTDLTKKRIERVQRARLYLLQQTGPNSFLIGGDSPDHKFRVIIGPQTCSCGRGPHCVHVLFVMLRVFQVGENDPCLWSRTLKNYEVENLFRVYHDKRSSRIKRRCPSQRRKETNKQEVEADENIDEKTSENETTRPASESDTGSHREEEDTCPICLLEMLEGESLIKCENGCHNRLHHHCISVWFEECRRQNDTLNCPLCRAQWKTTTVEINGTQESMDAPPNTRASSPQHSTTEEDSSRLPHADPIPPELEDTAAPWVEALGIDLVSCLLSRNWSFRETGLKHLSKEVMATLLKGTGEGRSGIFVSPVRRAATHNMLQTACNILAYMCADPVYRVFVASLRSLRTLLAYTPCRDEEQLNRLQTILKPVIEAVIVKSTDGNRRTSQLSLSTLVELCKGQDGELTVGREITNPGPNGLDGLNYVLKCVIEDYSMETVPWQWLLGRLYVIDRLLEEFPTDFLPRPNDNGDCDAAGAAEADSEDAEQGAAGTTYSTNHSHKQDDVGASNFARLMSVAHFSVKAVCSTHMRIARMSRRVFLLSAKLGAHVQNVHTQLKQLLAQIDSTSVASLKRKLDRIVEDFQLSERIVHELMHGSKARKGARFDSPCHTPGDSPLSSPRCCSPILYSETNNSDKSGQPPNAPPNTPVQRPKRKLKRTIPKRSFRETQMPSAPPPTIENSPEKCSTSSYKENIPLERKSSPLFSDLTYGPQIRLGSSSPPSRKRSSLPRRRRTIEGETVSKRGPSSSPTIRRKTVDGSSINRSSSPIATLRLSNSFHLSSKSLSPVKNIPEISVTNSLGQITGAFNPVTLSDLEETLVKEDEVTVDSKNNLFDTLKINSSSTGENVTLCQTNESVEGASTNAQQTSSRVSQCLCECRCHAAFSQNVEMTPVSGAAGVPNTPESGDDNAYTTTEQESMSSDDCLDYSQDTSRNNEKPVSFKSEVADSPKNSPSHSVQTAGSSKNDDCGTCKEEVEKEEAEALAKALEVSEHQEPTPVVPGLTPTAREEVITIRIQPDQEEGTDANKQPTSYLENMHWVKGPLIGTGAYSSCYQARDVRTGVIMACKQISFCRNSAQEQEKVIEAITEEIQLMAKLSHPNVVRILGATKQGCHFNMFVEWMPGGSIAYLLGEYGAFTTNVIVNYTKQLLRGLAYLHDNHILHRDLKGANLLVNSTGQTLRIGDFGASARLASQATGAGEFQGQLLGTIAFMAPEVLRGENYGRACDIWSAGCVMIEMCTTKPPWNATDISNHLALIFKIASSVDSPPIPENLPPALKDAMLRCLEQKSEDRPTAKELLLHPVFTQCFTSTVSNCNSLNS